MHIIKLKKFYFINKLNLENLNKLNEDVSVIYRKYTGNVDEKEIVKIKRICKKHRRMFFISNNFKLALKHSLDGVYLPSFNKDTKHLSFSLKKNFQILGSAHNPKEIKLKETQKITKIFISSIFKKNKNYLGLNKFKLLSKFTKKKVVALGGISKKNINLLKLTKSCEFAGISYFE